MRQSKLKIKDLGKVITGKTPDTSNRRYYDGPYRFVTPSDIDYRNYYCRKTETTVTNEAEQKFRNQFIPQGSTMFVCIGNTIGKCALSDQRCITNQQINSIVPSNIEHGRFIYYLMINNIEIVRGVGIGGGVASPIINKTKFESLSVNVPTKDKWIEIGEFLSLYDDLIERNNRRIHLLEEAARLLFREWFVYFHFPGNGKIKKVEGVTEGWEKGFLEDITTIKKGRNITFEQAIEGDIPVVGGGLEPTYFHNKANVCAPVVTVSASGANAGYVNLYYSDVWASDCSYMNRETTKNIFYLFLMLKSMQAYISGMQVGAAQPHVYSKDLMRLKILIPPEDLRKRFELLVTPIFDLIKNLKYQNQKLAQARDLLLPRLMSGVIEV